MAILRASEIREMSAEELDDKLSQLQNDLMKIRGILASGGIPEHVGRMKETRRTIARIHTIRKAKGSKPNAAAEKKADSTKAAGLKEQKRVKKK